MVEAAKAEASGPRCLTARPRTVIIEQNLTQVIFLSRKDQSARQKIIIIFRRPRPMDENINAITGLGLNGLPRL